MGLRRAWGELTLWWFKNYYHKNTLKCSLANRSSRKLRKYPFCDTRTCDGMKKINTGQIVQGLQISGLLISTILLRKSNETLDYKLVCSRDQIRKKESIMGSRQARPVKGNSQYPSELALWPVCQSKIYVQKVYTHPLTFTAPSTALNLTVQKCFERSGF